MKILICISSFPSPHTLRKKFPDSSHSREIPAAESPWEKALPHSSWGQELHPSDWGYWPGQAAELWDINVHIRDKFFLENWFLTFDKRIFGTEDTVALNVKEIALSLEGLWWQLGAWHIDGDEGHGAAEEVLEWWRHLFAFPTNKGEKILTESWNTIYLSRNSQHEIQANIWCSLKLLINFS